MHFIGIDIGGASSKLAVMDERGEFCELFLLPSGFSAVKVARQIKQALEQKGYAEGFVTATGYGRVSVEYAQLSMSEILCHGLGAHFLFEQDCTVIDVGGQDTKAIKIENGKPADFIMNDKCSAGTGKFLEISAGRLGLELSEIYKTELDPRIGFLHEPNYRALSLHLDLAEIFKPILGDRLIFGMLNKREIAAKDFETDAGRIRFGREAVQKIELKMIEKLSSCANVAGQSLTWRQIIRREANQIKKYVCEGVPYEGLVWR